ncbi:MAG TPA: pyridoxal phosphate-dependent aminotransferase, partial [bacterium]|nr:pyridoxal phosphate-dependent aminotransferase [bacterium]
ILLDTFLPVCTPVQNALPLWLAEQNNIHHEIYDRLNSNLSLLSKSLSDYPSINLLKPEGGWYAILRIPQTQSEEAWCLEFLEKDHVLVHPGYFFDFEEEAHLVLSLLPPSIIFAEGLNRILKRIHLAS